MVKQITQKRLENVALYYLQRYESSAFKLQNVLLRRVMRAKMQQQDIPSEVHEWIRQIVEKMQHLGYVDDTRYAQNQFRILSGSGKSAHYIYQKLKQDGIDPQIIENLYADQTPQETDLESAKRLVKKKKMGLYRAEQERALMFKKDLAVLARAGFSYEIACHALQES